jgi:cardiolipin synthase
MQSGANSMRLRDRYPASRRHRARQQVMAISGTSMWYSNPSPFWLPYQLMGVDVKVMLSARPSGNRLSDWASNTYIEEIVSAGVRVFLYEKGYLHAKTISIDSEICSIGSANIDIRSFRINYELNAVFYSAALAKELETDFERDLAGCTEFDPDVYRKRSTASRFRDSVARVLSPLL